MDLTLRRRQKSFIALWFLCIALGCSTSRLGAAPEGFWARWGDGLAEVSGYRLTQPRYGHPRDGTAVLIFVTETFSESARVKADPGKHPKSDEFPVLKLNFLKSFQTGIYSYHTMLSAFAHIDGHGSSQPGDLSKLTFSSQEWCGQVFEELIFKGSRIDNTRHSYFDGEGTESSRLALKKDGIALDNLPILVRSLLSKRVKPGQTLTVPALPTLAYVRLQHKPLEWTTATLSRSQNPEKLELKSGVYSVERWEITLADGSSQRWFVEVGGDRRIVAWEGSDGERGELLKTARLKYWELNKPGDEKWLEQVGIGPGAQQ